MDAKTERNWAVALHLSLFSGALFPIAGIVAPVAIWLSKRAQSEFVDRQGKEAMNFLISEGVAGVVLLLMALAVSALRQFGGENLFVDFLLPAALVLTVIPLCVVGFVLPILAAIKCSNGEDFRYPFIARLVK